VSTHPIELLAVISGIACVLLVIRQNVWSWPVGLIQVGLYVFIFMRARLYSDVLLHAVYVVLQFYGWYAWLHRTPGGERLTVRRLKAPTFRRWLLAGLAATATLGWLMWRFTDAAAPFPDAAIAAFSLVAQYLLARKNVEAWYLWIIVDVLAIGVYAGRDLYLTSGLYLIFLGMAILGLREWTRSLSATAA